MKKIKKFLKVSFVVLLIFFSAGIIGSFSYFTIVTHSISLDTNKLEEAKSVSNLKVFDCNLEEIKPTTSAFIPISKLSSHTKNAFISAEDKRFYKHGGLDFVRIGGAIISNLKTKSFSEGASTISQQLIKNTQLSNEKTIKRKLKEFKLTKQLENKYSKDEILEMYLNNIYFGNGCYGIENASQHYFSKSATNLTLAESALLASTINAPSIYDIENNYEKAIERKNLIIDLMLENKKINDEEATQAKSESPTLNISKLSSNNFLFSQILNEAHTILNLPENSFNNSSYKIYTSLDKKLCDEISKQTSNYKIESSPDITTIVIDNKSHGIVCATGKQKNFLKKWQPGSTIKPILVYAPAIESGQISPATKILDNKINISGYCPENADKKYHGFVSVREALTHSYNIPAVKILNEHGITTAQNFAKNLGIEFTSQDNNLAIALGGFTEGVTPKSLCDAYSAFANNGNFSKSSFITKITKDEKVIYKQKPTTKKVMKDSTAFLITNILEDSTKTGTAKRLADLPYQVASKTGTVGKSNSKKNICAYNVAYTTSHTIISLITGDNLPESVNGSTYPTMISKDILKTLYKNSSPKDFMKPSSVTEKYLSLDEYSKNNLVISNKKTDTIKEYFELNSAPKESEEKLFHLSVINTPKRNPLLCFTLNKKYDFSVIKTKKEEEKILFSSSKNTQNFVVFEDKTSKNNEICEYKIKFCEKSTNEEFYSNPIKIKAF